MMILRANEGKLLTNGLTFGKVVYLGKNDSADNWHEVDETEVVEGGESNG
jgi:hypothetical protein